MNFELEKQVALVTGGTGEIGKVIAKTLLESGAVVAVTGSSENSVQQALQELAPYGAVKGYVLDIRKTQEITSVVETIRKELGEIQILIQAAGVMRGANGMTLSEEEWDLVNAVNVKGLFFVMQQVVEQSMKLGGGKIVNISSMAGIRGMTPPMCSAHYSASKGAVNAVTRQAAVEWAHLGIRCNAVIPGGVLVGPMAKMGVPPELVANVPMKSLSHPQDVANAVCFLASEASAMITGQCLVVDGGASIAGN